MKEESIAMVMHDINMVKVYSIEMSMFNEGSLVLHSQTSNRLSIKTLPAYYSAFRFFFFSFDGNFHKNEQFSSSPNYSSCTDSYVHFSPGCRILNERNAHLINMSVHQ
jgi:hypothetical protein